MVDRRHHRTQRLRCGDDGVRGFTTEAKARREGADLHGRPCAGEKGLECAADVAGVEGAAFEEHERLVERDRLLRAFAHAAAPSLFTQLARSSLPCVVRMLSGWNWTPSTGRSLWRSPMISP